MKIMAYVQKNISDSDQNCNVVNSFVFTPFDFCSAQKELNSIGSEFEATLPPAAKIDWFPIS